MTIDSWFVYIVECSDLSYYVGISNNVTKRIKTHNLGKGSKYTRGRLPVKLLFTEKHSNKSEAGKREIQLKSWSRKKKEMLMSGQLFQH